jgi:hypothetical protein
MHKIPFAHNITHVENVGGDIDEVLNIRCRIGAFPWKINGRGRLNLFFRPNTDNSRTISRKKGYGNRRNPLI